MNSIDAYSVQEETKKLLEHGILKNPLMKNLLPELEALSSYVRFEGESKPSIPINWRFAESISSLKAFEALMLCHLITKKYNVEPQKISINTDHASLFFMSPLVAQYSLHRVLVTNIYKTKDGRFYHVHGSMNPDLSLTALGLPLDGEPDDTYDAVVERIQNVVSQIDSSTLDERMNEQYRQAGTIAWTSEEYFASEHGQKSGQIGLYEIMKDPNSLQPASWWPEHESHPSSLKRPLAGLKVVDLTRVTAGPTITRGLAEIGASVMRVTSIHITDLSPVHQDLNWGKWNCYLHLKDETDKEKLRELIREADVVVDGYRPGVMERLGFGRQAIFELVKDRKYGIIHVRENCYGWYGPWSHRSGWQQISDACCGVSVSYSKAMGNDEAVTPVFPNSDYCTGVCGSTAVLEALTRRAEHGGCYGVDISLNYYSQWLVPAVLILNKFGTNYGHHSPVFRHYHAMQHLLPTMMKLLHQYDSKTLFQPNFFESRTAPNIGVTFIQVKPVAQFDNSVELKYNVGTRGNGVDQPRWPKDLKVEVVTGEN